MAKSDVDFDQAKQISIIIVVAAVLMNVAFFFLSKAYYDDRAATYGMASAETIRHTRIAFAVLTAIVGASSIASVFAPRLVAHGLAGFVGLAALAGAIGAVAKDYHPVLPVALGLLGGLIIALVIFSLQRSRPAWAFLVACCAVGGLVTLFGATKVRNAAGIPLFYALALPGILVVATIMLSMLSEDYAESESA